MRVGRGADGALDRVGDGVVLGDRCDDVGEGARLTVAVGVEALETTELVESMNEVLGPPVFRAELQAVITAHNTNTIPTA